MFCLSTYISLFFHCFFTYFCSSYFYLWLVVLTIVFSLLGNNLAEWKNVTWFFVKLVVQKLSAIFYFTYNIYHIKSFVFLKEPNKTNTLSYIIFILFDCRIEVILNIYVYFIFNINYLKCSTHILNHEYNNSSNH